MKKASNWLHGTSSYYHGLFASYWLVGRYPEAVATLQRALAVDPKETTSRLSRARLELEWRADTKPLHDILDVLAKENPAAAVNSSNVWMDLALCERDPDAAERAVAVMTDGLTYEGVQLPQPWFEGLAARIRGDKTAARIAFTAARVAVEEDVAKQPDYGPPLCALGLIDAALGRKDEATQEGRRAQQLLPVTKDAVKGQVIMEFLAVIYALTGEKDLAVDQLEVALRSPVSYTFCRYGHLRLNPFWDPLRGDSRFEKLVASLAPKPGK